MLFLNPRNIASIDGLTVDQAAHLIATLVERIDLGDFAYRHEWQPGDVVMWDNAGGAHKATEPDIRFVRLMERRPSWATSTTTASFGERRHGSAGRGPEVPLESTPLISATRYLAYLRDQGMPADALVLPRIAILAWSELSLCAAREAGALRRHTWLYNRDWPLFIDKDRSLAVLRQPTGAPAAVLLMEILAACGVRTIIGLSIAGSIDPAISVSSLVVPTDALATDGTSAHYLHSSEVGSRRSMPSAALAEQVMTSVAEVGYPVLARTVWTTDAIFREQPAEVEWARAAGATVVDMETSALYAAASCLGVETSSLLVVTDELHATWRPGFHLPQVRKAQNHAVTAVVRAARSWARRREAGACEP